MGTVDPEKGEFSFTERATTYCQGFASSRPANRERKCIKCWAGSHGSRFVRGPQMPAAPQNDRVLESAEVWLGRLQIIVELPDFLPENFFRLVPFLGKRVKGMGKPVVEPCETRDLLRRNDLLYECIS